MSVAHSPLPLCVDCDGTLIRSDLLHESVFLLLRSSWLTVFRLPFWLLRGKAHLKQRLSERVQLDASRLPYNDDVINLVRQARSEGRTTVLVTASPRRQAEQVAEHVGLFDRVEATDDEVNLSGQHKAEHLEKLYGRAGFVYAGNSTTDLPVWAASGGAVVVSNSEALNEAAAKRAPLVQSIRPGTATLKSYLKAIRLHQWLKNLLVFVPVLAAHKVSTGGETLAALLAFFAFGLCASAVYVINDLLDLPSDRLHARKRTRPFASGVIPIWHGVVMVPLLLAGSAVLCTQLPILFALALSCYFLLTCLYSFWLKNHVVVDVMMLTSLYTMRIIAGAAATAIVPSFWLLAFSMFIFLSLAIVKRYSEMLVAVQNNKQQAAGRGYYTSDMPVLLALGSASGFNAILILALYVNSPDLGGLYPNVWALWMILPPMLYWISRVWMKAHRGELHDDPVVFAATDRQSWCVALILAAVLWIATLG
jgi:4-hydroxybenzoate polyprenyltransferase/phosphoserine phosphatase